MPATRIASAPASARARSASALVAIALCLALTAAATAQPAPDDLAPPPTDDDILLSTGALEAKIAVMRFDALGMDAERVTRLEALFRKELERLARQPMPSRRVIDDTIRGSRQLRRCAGDDGCLAEIGKSLSVDVVVSGNVAALGDSYVINIKVVDSKRGTQIRRITSDPLRGNPDELIDAVRVAAYRLLAPEQLLGSATVLTDLVGAQISLDGQVVGKAPLAKPIYKLPVGPHQLRVEADGYMPYEQEIEVRFQKTTRVVVRLAKEGSAEPIVTPEPVIRLRPAEKRWYTSTWFYVAAGVTAGVVGGYVGYKLALDPVIDCDRDPSACRP